jgi:hypothetical protein
MAKVTITIEDLGSGGVKVISEPNFETIMKLHISGHDLTSAHGYALSALNTIRQKSKEMKQEMKVLIPKLK